MEDEPLSYTLDHEKDIRAIMRILPILDMLDDDEVERVLSHLTLKYRDRRYAKCLKSLEIGL